MRDVECSRARDADTPAAGGLPIVSIPFAYLLTRRLRGIDVRRVGSGNVGAANVFRTTSVTIGLTVMALDMAKGLGGTDRPSVRSVTHQRVDRGSCGDRRSRVSGLDWFSRGQRVWRRRVGSSPVLAPIATAAASLLFSERCG